MAKSKAIELPEADPEQYRRARALADKAPVPARAGSIACGTAGWTDPTLIRAGTFYPETAKSPADRLIHYARHFPIVEVDATFYAIPAPSVSLQWIDRTPSSFVFDIKAHPILTGHPIDRARLPAELASALSSDKRRLYPGDLPAEVRSELEARFKVFLEPLRQAGRLGCVMVQLPPWTTATRGAVRQIEALPARLPGVRIAVEFRHPSWMEQARRDRVLAMLRANGMAHVVVDEPDVAGGGVPAVLHATHDQLAVIRFHGHNVAGWHKGASVLERFNYLYTPEQVAAWVQPVRRLAEQSAEVHAVFNNCVRDYAVIGAKDLAALLATGPAPVNDDAAPAAHPC
jgi:uncharacterized protein YecE (DUF72 family)